MAVSVYVIKYMKMRTGLPKVGNCERDTFFQ